MLADDLRLEANEHLQSRAAKILKWPEYSLFLFGHRQKYAQ